MPGEAENLIFPFVPDGMQRAAADVKEVEQTRTSREEVVPIHFRPA